MLSLGGKLHAVSGPEFSVLGKKPLGYIVDMASGNLVGTWQVKIEDPHSVLTRIKSWDPGFVPYKKRTADFIREVFNYCRLCAVRN